MTRLALVNGTVFDGVSILAETSVTVVDGRIESVGEPPAAADRIIDAQGGTILPGLVDAHFHAFGTDADMLAVESTPLSYLALAAAQRLGAALDRGFTTVRDPAGGDPGLAQAVTEGLLRSPRYLWTGAALCQTGGHGDPRSAGCDVHPPGAHMTEVVDGVDALTVAVRERLRRGAHAIKIMTSGSMLSPTFHLPEYSAAEISAVASAAARRGSYVTAHAYSVEAVRLAVENGVRCIEHGNFIDMETAQLMSETGTFLVPTLVVYEDMARLAREAGDAVLAARLDEALTAGRTAIRHARSAGVRIGFGTDLLGAQETSQLRGLVLQAETDGAENALHSATAVNAELIGRPDLGRIELDRTADLLVLAGDPFTEPGVLATAGRTVIQQGVVRYDDRTPLT